MYLPAPCAFGTVNPLLLRHMTGTSLTARPDAPERVGQKHIQVTAAVCGFRVSLPYAWRQAGCCESGRSLLSAASSTAGLARLVAAHITLAWAGDAAGAAQVREGKLLA